MDHQVSGWDSRHIRRPGDVAVLSVIGQCNLPAIFRAVLEVSEKQGNDPTQLCLDLIIHVPSGKPPTAVENKCTLNIAFKLPTEQTINTLLITDVNADPDSDEEKVWTVPVKIINWGTVATAAKSKRWTGEALSHRQN